MGHIRTKKAGSYVTKFLKAVDSRSSALLAMHFGALSKTQRDDFHNLMSLAGADSIFLGRMNFVLDHVRYLINEQRASKAIVKVYPLIKQNGVYLFAPACGSILRKILEEVNSLKEYNSGNIIIDGLFVQHVSIPLEYVYGIPSEFECTAPNHMRKENVQKKAQHDKRIGDNPDNIRKLAASGLVENSSFELEDHTENNINQQSEIDIKQKAEKAELEWLCAELREFLSTSTNHICTSTFSCAQIQIYRIIVGILSTGYEGAYEAIVQEYDNQFSVLLSICFDESEVTGSFLEKIVDTWTHMSQNSFCFPSFSKPVHICLKGIIKDMFQKHVFHGARVQQLSNAVINLIHSQRTGQQFNDTLMKGLISILDCVQPSSYEEFFEKPFLISSRDFYNEELQRFDGCHNIDEYVMKLDALIISEVTILSYVQSHAKETCLRFLVKVALEHVSWQSNYHGQPQLKLLYRTCHDLFTKDTFSLIEESLVSHLSSALDIIENASSGSFLELILGFANVKKKFDQFIEHSFQMDIWLTDVLRRSFDAPLSRVRDLPKIISQYISENLSMRNSISHENDEVDELLDFVCYTDEVSQFCLYYHHDMSARLMHRAYNLGAEMKMLKKLEAKFGTGYVQSYMGMLNDISSSNEYLRNIADTQPSNEPQIHAHVITGSYWPLQQLDSCSIPTVLKEPLDQVETNFSGTHRHLIKLQWQPSLGRANLKATFPEGQSYTLNVSSYQMIILDGFDLGTWRSLSNIRDMTNIPDDALWESLHSLCCIDGQKLLIKEPRNTLISENDLFKVNNEFTCDQHDVYVNMDGCLNRRLSEALQKGRHVEKSIVKTLKVKNKLLCVELFKEVKDDLKADFVLSSALFESSINLMIKKHVIIKDDAEYQLSD